MVKGTLSRLIFSLLLMVLLLAGSTWLFFEEFYLFGVLVGLVAGCSVVLVVKVFLVNTRKTTFMFNAIENGDFTFQFPEHYSGYGDKMFNRSLNRIKNIMQQTRLEIAQREKYYEIILDHSSSGIIVVDPATGIVYQVNRAAEQLLGVGTLSHINQLSIISSEIPFALRSIDPSESRTVSFYNETSKVRLSLSASMVRLNNRLLKVVAMKDISAELDNEQTQSWMQLSRVLTHEIMNSLAPITSLSEQLRTTTDLQTMHRGLEIISTTGKGLIEFVDNYRRLTRIPTPVMCEFSLLDLLKKVVGLISSRIEIEQVSDSMVVCADENLISQVLTNLLKNAIEATPNGERIWVKAYPSVGGQRTVIEVCNCGVPIDKEVRENIFVPFFTTKTGGSGIGLSLSRQIMRLHNGTLTLASGVVNGQSITCFILTI